MSTPMPMQTYTVLISFEALDLIDANQMYGNMVGQITDVESGDRYMLGNTALLDGDVITEEQLADSEALMEEHDRLYVEQRNRRN